MVVRQHKLLTLALALAALAGCVAPELEDVEKVEIGTHASDWRSEVIYQLMTDRFANGDARNDHRVDPSALGHYQGGDWQGIIDRLDYLEELGVTALWISPIVLNVDADAGFHAYHGYWSVNLNRLNPHFGDLATLRRLVKEAHARDIKIILDLVTNHMGQVFYYDINNNGQPDEWLAGGGQPGMDGSSPTAMNDPLSRVTEYDPDYDPRGIQGFTSLGLNGLAPIRFFDMPDIWRLPPEPAIFQKPEAYNRRGRVTNWDCVGSPRVKGVDANPAYDLCDQVVLGDFPGGLKDINTQNAQVREALIDAYVRWVLETDLDGFRIDTLKHVEHDFWRVWSREVRARLAKAGKKNFFMFGEAFDGRDALVGSYTKPGMLDSVFYFPQYYRVIDNVFRRFGSADNEAFSTRAIEALFTDRDTKGFYGTEAQPGGIGVAPNQALVNFLDNHDVPRFLFENAAQLSCAKTGRCKEALRSALTYLFTEDGIPCLYNGTEQEFDGGNDPANREPLWRSDYDTENATFKHIQKLIALRKGSLALRHGKLGMLWSSPHTQKESDAGIVAFERRAGNEVVIVVINVHPEQTSSTSFDGTDMLVDLPAGTKLTDRLGTLGEPLVVSPAKTLKVSLPPYGAAVLATTP
jgi:alpha-amylase